MNRQLRSYLSLCALLASVFAFPSDNSLNVGEKNALEFSPYLRENQRAVNVKEVLSSWLSLVSGVPQGGFNAIQQRFSGNKGEIVKIEKPVNERFPHAVLFGRTCGGTIISPNWILTAAHCTIFTSGRAILAGTGISDNDSGVVHSVKRKIIHPRFAVGPYWLDSEYYNLKQVGARFDFMLAELEEPLKLDNKTIAAAKLNENRDLPPKTNVSYAGYGTKYHGGTMRHQMHEMKLELLSKEQCGTLKEYDSQDMVCAKGRPPNYDSACNGDSGSGLVDDNGVLVGILSWAEKDTLECYNGATVYFSKIAEARDWIREVANV